MSTCQSTRLDSLSGRAVLAAFMSLTALSGCAGSMPAKTTSWVDVSESRSNFHQSHQLHAWSASYFTDSRGDRWLQGMSLSGRATRLVNDDQTHLGLEFRHDETQRDPAAGLEPVYEQARKHRDRLLQTCKQIILTVDGETFRVPVRGINVRVLTNRERMPLPPTDQPRDRPAEFVERNTAGHHVLSTGVSARIDAYLLGRLASASSVHYEVCGQTADASQEEIAGLKRLHEWAL